MSLSYEELEAQLRQRNQACDEYAATIYKQAKEIEELKFQQLLDVNAICEQRDRSVKERDELKAALKHHQTATGAICLPDQVPISYAELLKERDSFREKAIKYDELLVLIRSDAHAQGKDTPLNVLEQIKEKLKEQREKAEALEKCVGHWTKDGKPVPCGSTLLLLPNNDESREPMKLKIPESSHTCWYLTVRDNISAINLARRETK